MRGTLSVVTMLAGLAGNPLWGQTPSNAPEVHPRETGVFGNPRVTSIIRAPGPGGRSSRAAILDSLDADSLYLPASPVSAAATTNSPVTSRSGISPPMVVSRLQSNLVWTFNPAGHDTELYAADTTGRDLGTFELTGINNIEWVAIAEGPCGLRTCIYLGDLGDPLERRSSITLYRFEEPLIARDRLPRTYAVVRVDSLSVRYPDGPRDAQAMYLTRDGSTYLVTNGRSRGVSVYRVTAGLWIGYRQVRADSLGTLSLERADRLGAITGAALSPDGHTLALRSPTALLMIPAGPRGEPVTDSAPVICDLSKFLVAGLGLSWVDDRLLAITIIQGQVPAAAIVLVPCGR